MAMAQRSLDSNAGDGNHVDSNPPTPSAKKVLGGKTRLHLGEIFAYGSVPVQDFYSKGTLRALFERYASPHVGKLGGCLTIQF